MSDLKEVVAAYTPKTEKVDLCPDQRLLAEERELREELQAKRAEDTGTLADADTSDLEAQLREVHDRIEDATVEFRVESIGRKAWKDLRDEHQPDEATRKRYEERGASLDWDPDEFPPVAIAASLVSPAGDDDEETLALCRRIWEEWDNGEAHKLWEAVLAVNVQRSSIPKWPVGSATTWSSDAKSRPPGTLASAGPSSSEDNDEQS